jgi:hypothetical protein
MVPMLDVSDLDREDRVHDARQGFARSRPASGRRQRGGPLVPHCFPDGRQLALSTLGRFLGARRTQTLADPLCKRHAPTPGDTLDLAQLGLFEQDLKPLTQEV